MDDYNRNENEVRGILSINKKYEILSKEKTSSICFLFELIIKEKLILFEILKSIIFI